MEYYTEKTLQDIFEDATFLSTYKTYYEKNHEINEFIKFIDSIAINKKYFRLGMNKKTKRFKNQNVSEDTIAIKEINSYLNKVTDRNIDPICNEIKKRLVNKEYLTKYIIETIIEKSCIQPNYVHVYLDTITQLFSHESKFNSLIEENIDSFYKKIKKQEINIDQSEYLQFCEKNKQLDILIGHSQLISECERRGIVKDKIEFIIDELMNVIDITEDINEKYKGVQCLYTILKTYYQNKNLPKYYLKKIQSCIKKEKSNKIKFKLMDIIDRK